QRPPEYGDGCPKRGAGKGDLGSRLHGESHLHEFRDPGDRGIPAEHDSGAKLSDPRTGKQIGRTLEHDRANRNVCKSIITCWAFSLDGKLVATGSRCALAPDGSEGQICVWDVATGARLAEYHVDERARRPIGDVRGLAFSDDGK